MSEGLLVCGVTGVGKSSMVGEIGRVVSGAGRPIAVVDTDQLAQFGPPPPKDAVTGRRTFYDELKCRNLSSVWTNFRAAGAKHIVVAAGIESVELRAAYIEALDGCDVQMVRLVAPTTLVQQRLRGRDNGATLERHLRTLTEQEALLDEMRLEDFTVVNDRSYDDVAREIASRAGWLDPT